MKGKKPMKIIHTSDWHLGCSIYGRKRYEEAEAFLDWLSELLAASQNADGSFGSMTGEKSAIIEETVQAIICILENAGSINLFRNQLLKALIFLMTREETIREDKDLLGLVSQVLQMPRIDRIIRMGEQDVKDFVDRILASDN